MCRLKILACIVEMENLRKKDTTVNKSDDEEKMACPLRLNDTASDIEDVCDLSVSHPLAETGATIGQISEMEASDQTDESVSGCTAEEQCCLSKDQKNKHDDLPGVTTQWRAEIADRTGQDKKNSEDHNDDDICQADESKNGN